MQICTKEAQPAMPKNPPLIKGNIYKRKGISWVYICAPSHRLVNLETGDTFADTQGFSSYKDWVDVTDKYCLKEL